LIFINIEAHPKPDSEDYGIVSGAQAACWVDTDDPHVAERRVRKLLDESGWDTEALEEARLVTREEYEGAPDSLKYFDQAVRDGIVVSMHTWPVGAPDE
jgi:hypothetical protein